MGTTTVTGAACTSRPGEIDTHRILPDKTLRLGFGDDVGRPQFWNLKPVHVVKSDATA